MNILFIGNSDLVFYNFRKELIYTLIGDGHKVTLVCPFGTKIKKLVEYGCQFYNWDLNRHSINPFLELKSLMTLSVIIKRIKPDYVLSFTIKPNLYSGFLSKSLQFKHIPNITGLGKVFSKNSILKN
jgi:galacturonosyltransferase